MNQFRYTLGIDNGSTGTIGIIGPNAPVFVLTPTIDSIHYGKSGSISKRLDRSEFKSIIENNIGKNNCQNTRVVIERPFTGSPMMIKSMLHAHRFFESTICCLEDLGFGYEVVDSGTWQKSMLGEVKGSAELKKASKLRGQQIYPQFTDLIKKHGDADGLLIAHHASKG